MSRFESRGLNGMKGPKRNRQEGPEVRCESAKDLNWRCSAQLRD